MSRRRKLLLWLTGLVLLPLMILIGLLFYLPQSERGAELLWRMGAWTLKGKLSGTYVSGTLLSGLHLRDVGYRDGETQIYIDDVDGKWRVGRSPLGLNIESLRIGTVDARLAPSTTPATLPQALRLPLAVRLNALSVQKLILRQNTSTTEFGNLLAHGESDALRHTLVVDAIETPYGKAAARLQLNGLAPFALNGDAQIAGNFQKENFQLAAKIGGTLAAVGLDVDASGDKLNGKAKVLLTPFSSLPFERIELSADHVNPKLFDTSAPQADLSMRAALVPSGSADKLAVSGPFSLTNATPGPVDSGRLPLISASAEVLLDQQHQQLKQLKIKLAGNGMLTGQGEMHLADGGKSAGEFRVEAAALDLHAMHTQLKPTQLHGPLTLKLQAGQQHVVLQMEDPQVKIALDALIDARMVTLKMAKLNAGAAQIDVTGTLARDANMAYALQGKLRDFNPAVLLAGSPSNQRAKTIQGRVNMDFDVTGSVAPELNLQLKFDSRDSEYGGLPMTGKGKLSVSGKRLLSSDVQMLVAGNSLLLNGGFGTATDRLNVKLDAPQLERLGFGLAGLLQLDGKLSGTFNRPNINATYRAERLVFGEHRVATLSGKADVQGDLASTTGALANSRLDAKIVAQGYAGPGMALRDLNAELAGTFGKHTLSLVANGSVRDRPLGLKLNAQGKLEQTGPGKAGQATGGLNWSGVIGTLENSGSPRFVLDRPVSVNASATHVVLGATHFTLAGAPIDLKHFSYEQGRIRSAGSADALDVGKLLALQSEFTGVDPALKTDLVVDGRWDFSIADTATGYAELVRRSGDVIVNTGRGESSLGLTEMRVRADLQGKQIRLDGQAKAARVGSLSAQFQAAFNLQDGKLSPAADMPVSGQASLSVPQLKTIGNLLGPQFALDGSIDAKLSVSGTLSKPKWSGEVAGDKLALTLFDQGIQLKDGIARLALTENVIELRQLEFHGGSGTLKATGLVKLGATDPDMSALIVADKLQIFASPDRQLTLSGQAKMASVADKLNIDGNFKVDSALFDLPKSGAPKLGDDVVIVRRSGKVEVAPAASAQDKAAQASAKPAGRFAPVVVLHLDLGDDFQFRGTGAELQLRGNMEVRSEPFRPLRATGTVRVVNGTYEAFGRKLAIERGLINFQGPLDNPNINIRAMRRNQSVEAGVEVTGLARRPRIKLVSEPSVSDEEALSWLMFGHGSESTVLGEQQAASTALGLLGNAGTKRISQGIGLDTFSIGPSESGLNDQQVVHLGKAISEKFTLGYEQSLSGAASIAKLSWQISRRWSVIMRGGAINGVDVLFSRRFD
ncbi:translocation/assembly module TamB domain-containing protein [soil metagenome]